MYMDRWSRDLGKSLPFLDGHIDGLLFVGPLFKDPILERVAAAGLPTVALLTRHAPPNVGYVTTDNYGAMRIIVEHLVSLGRCRIGYAGPTHVSNYLDRYNGIRDALAAMGPACESSIVKHVTIDLTSPWEEYNRSFEVAHRKLIESADKLDAIVAPDDWWAQWTLTALAERGIRVPDDIAVVGFDDVRIANTSSLTTIRQPFRNIGQVAVQLLLAMLEGAPASECQVTLPGELIVRSSTVASPAG
jgi:LacI family transcriptional regulator